MFKFVVKRNTKELFHRAVAENDVLRVKILLQHALEDPKFGIDDINEEGLTALQNSCFTGNIDMVKLLVSSGANIKIKDRDGWTLLHAAVMTGKLEIVKFLVENGLGVSLRNDKKQLPIEFAEDMPVVMYLLKKMLETGLEHDVHRYMRRHPHLKKEIYKEVELAIELKRQEIKALERLPYTPARNAKRRSTNDANSNTKSDSDSTAYSLNDKNSKSNGNESLQVLPKCTGEYFTLDVDDLPSTPNIVNKRWSSMSNIAISTDTELTEVKIHMHNGYETDNTDNHLINKVNKIKRIDLHNEPSQMKSTEAKEIDIASLNSHSTSGYETDEVDPFFLHQARKMVHSESDSTNLSSLVSFNNNRYQKKSNTMSPRTARRLEHRFGSLVMDDKEIEFERNKQRRSLNFKRVECPEVFL